MTKSHAFKVWTSTTSKARTIGVLAPHVFSPAETWETWEADRGWRRQSKREKKERRAKMKRRGGTWAKPKVAGRRDEQRVYCGTGSSGDKASELPPPKKASRGKFKKSEKKSRREAVKGRGKKGEKSKFTNQQICFRFSLNVSSVRLRSWEAFRADAAILIRPPPFYPPIGHLRCQVLMQCPFVWEKKNVTVPWTWDDRRGGNNSWGEDEQEGNKAKIR